MWTQSRGVRLFPTKIYFKNCFRIATYAHSRRRSSITVLIRYRGRHLDHSYRRWVSVIRLLLPSEPLKIEVTLEIKLAQLSSARTPLQSERSKTRRDARPICGLIIVPGDQNHPLFQIGSPIDALFLKSNSNSGSLFVVRKA